MTKTCSPKLSTTFKWGTPGLLPALAIALFLLVLLTGCTQELRARSTLDFSTEKTLYNIEPVVRSTPEVHIYPVDSALFPPNALMMPLPITQALGPREAEPMSKGLSRILWQALVKEEVFPVLEFAEENHIYTQGQALGLARYKNADVLVMGSIPYVIAGGSGGLNQITVRLEVYDVASGELIWSLVHSGMLEEKPYRDFLFFKQKSKLPADPLYAATAAVGSDLGKILHRWSWGALEDEEAPVGDQPKIDGGPKPIKENPAF